jgi:hypothetical protein
MKKLLSVVLSMAMLLTLMPMAAVTANADSFAVIDNTAEEVYVGGVLLKDGYYVGVGSKIATTTKPGEKYAYFKDGVLTLYN